MEENEAPYLNWQVVFLLIALAVLLGLLFVSIIFHFFFSQVVKKKDIEPSPRAGEVLGVVQSSLSPSPSASLQEKSPKPTSSPIPSPTSTSPPGQPPELSSPQLSQQQLNLPFSDSFENGLSSWTSSGNVSLMNQLSNPEPFTKPPEGHSMVRIGTPQNQGKPLSQNSLSLQLPNSATKLTFSYNFFSYDYVGFDDSGFTVSLGDQVLFQKSAADLDSDSAQTEVEHLDHSGWQTLTLALPQNLQTDTQQLSFKSGNDELNLPSQGEHQSWVYVDSIKIE